MLQVRFAAGKLELRQDGGVKLNIENDAITVDAEAIRLELVEGVPGLTMVIDSRLGAKHDAQEVLASNGGAGTEMSEEQTGSGVVDHEESNSKRTLSEFIEEVLRDRGGPLPVAEIARAVLDKGYETSSENFANTVRTTLKRGELGTRGAKVKFIQLRDSSWALREQ